MLTPQEVSDKAFPKASFGSGGYSMAAVDEFLDTLTEDYTGLYTENSALKGKLKVLAEKVEEYRATEGAMRATLLTAQKMADRLVQEAQEEKDQIIAKARADADVQIKELDNEVLLAQQRLEQARQQLNDFIADSRNLCAKQVAFLDALPDMPLAEEKPACVQESAREEEDVSSQSAAAGQENAEAEPEVPTGDTTVFDGDFTKTLGELQFGRNYDSKA